MITYKIDVYIPEDYIDLLIKKLGDEKIITIGNYDYCYTTSKVKGHFMPNNFSNNFSGEKNYKRSWRNQIRISHDRK